jgi:hypothetical protein
MKRNTGLTGARLTTIRVMGVGESNHELTAERSRRGAIVGFAVVVGA